MDDLYRAYGTEPPTEICDGSGERPRVGEFEASEWVERGQTIDFCRLPSANFRKWDWVRFSMYFSRASATLG